MKAEELQTEVNQLDASAVNIDSLVESYVQCREMVQDHLNQLQYLFDLYDKVHKVTSRSQIMLLLPKHSRMSVCLRVSRKLLEIDVRFQWTTNRKWPMVNRMVT